MRLNYGRGREMWNTCDKKAHFGNAGILPEFCVSITNPCSTKYKVKQQQKRSMSLLHATSLPSIK